MEKLEIKKHDDLVLLLNEYKRKLSRVETNLEIATVMHGEAKDKRKWKRRKKEITAYKRHYEKIILKIRRKLETVETRPGRPTEFEINDTLEWFLDLAKRPDYQKKNETPHQQDIVFKIMEYHFEKTGKTVSETLIKQHLKQLKIENKI